MASWLYLLRQPSCATGRSKTLGPITALPSANAATVVDKRAQTQEHIKQASLLDDLHISQHGSLEFSSGAVQRTRPAQQAGLPVNPTQHVNGHSFSDLLEHGEDLQGSISISITVPDASRTTGLAPVDAVADCSISPCTDGLYRYTSFQDAHSHISGEASSSSGSGFVHPTHSLTAHGGRSATKNAIGQRGAWLATDTLPCTLTRQQQRLSHLFDTSACSQLGHTTLSTPCPTHSIATSATSDTLWVSTTSSASSQLSVSIAEQQKSLLPAAFPTPAHPLNLHQLSAHHGLQGDQEAAPAAVSRPAQQSQAEPNWQQAVGLDAASVLQRARISSEPADVLQIDASSTAPIPQLTDQSSSMSSSSVWPLSYQSNSSNSSWQSRSLSHTHQARNRSIQQPHPPTSKRSSTPSSRPPLPDACPHQLTPRERRRLKRKQPQARWRLLPALQVPSATVQDPSSGEAVLEPTSSLAGLHVQQQHLPHDEHHRLGSLQTIPTQVSQELSPITHKDRLSSSHTTRPSHKHPHSQVRSPSSQKPVHAQLAASSVRLPQTGTYTELGSQQLHAHPQQQPHSPEPQAQQQLQGQNSPTHPSRTLRPQRQQPAQTAQIAGSLAHPAAVNQALNSSSSTPEVGSLQSQHIPHSFSTPAGLQPQQSQAQPQDASSNSHDASTPAAVLQTRRPRFIPGTRLPLRSQSTAAACNLTRTIRTATLAQLQQLLQLDSHSLNPRHIRAMLTRLVDIRDLQPHVRQDLKVVGTLAKKLLRLARARFESAETGPWELITCLSVCQKLRIVVEKDFVVEVMVHARRRLDMFDHEALAGLLHAVAKSGNRIRDAWIKQYYAALMMQQQQLTERSTAMIIHSLGMLQLKPPDDVLQMLLERMQKMFVYSSSQDVTMVLWGLAAMKTQPHPEFANAVLHASQPMLCFFKPEELSTCLWSLAQLQLQPSGSWWSAYFAAAQQRLQSSSSQSLAVTAYALALLGCKPEASFVSELVYCSGQQLAVFTFQGLGMLVYALGLLGYHPGQDWLDTFQARLEADRGEIDSRALDMIQSGYRMLGYQPSRGDLHSSKPSSGGRSSRHELSLANGSSTSSGGSSTSVGGSSIAVQDLVTTRLGEGVEGSILELSRGLLQKPSRFALQAVA